MDFLGFNIRLLSINVANSKVLTRWDTEVSGFKSNAVASGLK